MAQQNINRYIVTPDGVIGGGLGDGGGIGAVPASAYNTRYLRVLHARMQVCPFTSWIRQQASQRGT